MTKNFKCYTYTFKDVTLIPKNLKSNKKLIDLRILKVYDWKERKNTWKQKLNFDFKTHFKLNLTYWTINVLMIFQIDFWSKHISHKKLCFELKFLGHNLTGNNLLNLRLKRMSFKQTSLEQTAFKRALLEQNTIGKHTHDLTSFEIISL
jgi:hypothetical protein